ncbi:MAG: GYD domain-containing protein [Alphaproteobacteria bacterium]
MRAVVDPTAAAYRGLPAGMTFESDRGRSIDRQGRGVMAKYLFEARYGTEGAKGIGRDGGSARRAAVAKMAKSLGGKVDAFYYAFGGVDAYVIVDLPDNVAAAAAALVVNQAGAATVRTVVLLSPEDMDKASKKSVDYRPPGQARAARK